jgi:alpha-ketoglutarate-dependent taurine dioxygenase
MAFTITDLPATFGARVQGIRLAEIDIETFEQLYDLWLEKALLIFPDQHLSRQQQIALAKHFGPLEFDIAPISNVDASGAVRADTPDDEVLKVVKGNMEWHCDSTYMPVQAKGAVFSAEVVPPSGGETGFADMRAAYEALSPAEQERLAGLCAYHSLHYSQGRAGLAAKGKAAVTGYGLGVTKEPLRPLVKTHAETGRKVLMVGRHAHDIPGLDPAESVDLLDRLAEFACQPPRTYHHAWRPGDVVIWDNRSLMHRACPWDLTEARVMWHTRLAGDPAHETGLNYQEETL